MRLCKRQEKNRKRYVDDSIDHNMIEKLKASDFSEKRRKRDFCAKLSIFHAFFGRNLAYVVSLYVHIITCVFKIRLFNYC